jgi:hypothetical protein
MGKHDLSGVELKFCFLLSYLPLERVFSDDQGQSNSGGNRPNPLKRNIKGAKGRHTLWAVLNIKSKNWWDVLSLSVLFFLDSFAPILLREHIVHSNDGTDI